MAVKKKFVPRQRKHKVLARKKTEHDGPEAAADSNMAEILPEAIRERNEMKMRMREELRAGQPQMSAKKAKRLDKYVELKLQKDENRKLYERLAAKSIDTSMFESSKNLGVGKRRRNSEQRKREMMERLGESDSGYSDEASSSSEAEEAPAPRARPETPAARQQVPTKETHAKAAAEAPAKAVAEATTEATASVPATSSLFPQATKSVPAVVGSGLKRPLELGDDGRPVLQKRQKRGGVKSKYQVEQVHTRVEIPAPHTATDEDEEEEEEDDDDDGEWGGFSDEGEGEGEESAEIAPDDVEGQESSESESESENDESDGSADEATPMSGFKAWAQQKRNDALGFQPTTESTTSAMLDIPRPENFQPRAVEEEPLPIELQPSADTGRKVFNVSVTRTAEVEEARLKLPVVAEEQKIMEAIYANDVVVITGGTGSGKTTQVPQFLYEAGYGSPDSPTPGMIGVTQPRRVAAVSMSKRVAEELGSHGSAVAYQIRFEGTADKKTAIKFMTDGVLLRELTEDIVLSRYSAIIVDEAHERSINTDVLIGILSRINTMRRELNERNSGVAGWKALAGLKLIIMSATLQIEDLTQNTRLFPVPPRVVSVEGRQFPVTIHFSQRTQTDYVEEAFRKVVRGHRRLPPGSFLVFLTGEDEIQQLAKRLRREINGLDVATGPKVRLSTSEVPLEAEDIDFGGGGLDADMEAIEAIEGTGLGDDDDDDDDDGDGRDADDEFVVDEAEGEAGTGPLRINVLPLYSKLPTREQQKVFRAAPDGYRQVILATNVAETSLTIPGVRFVFDCGRAKERKYNHVTGVQSFEVGWINKASANQRSGRAGRTSAGHCYRLYSSALYEASFAEFAEPEVLRMPIEGVVLQLKSLNVPKIDLFPFPTPPDRRSLEAAERLLQYIGAVQPTGQISELGRVLASFPLSPRYAKMLLLGNVQGCMHYAIALVAALSADEIFVRPGQAVPGVEGREDDSAGGSSRPRLRTQEDIRQEEQRRAATELFRKVHRQFSSTDERSDALKRLHVVAEFSDTPTEAWCRGHFVLHKALREIQKIRRQLTQLLRTNVPALADLAYTERLARPTETQVVLLKQMVAAGFVDHVAMRADAMAVPPNEFVGRLPPRRAIEVAYVPLVPLAAGETETGSGLVFIHPASPLAHCTVAECPPYVVYSHLQQSRGPASASASAAGGPAETATVLHGDGSIPLSRPKIRMRTLTNVTGKQLAVLARGTPLLSYGKPIKETAVSADGRERECWVVPYLRAQDASVGGLGWPLPAVLVKQRKEPGKGWKVVA